MTLQFLLRRKNLLVETEKKYEIFYQNQRVGFYIADIVVNESVIIKAKCCKELAPQHSAQLLNYPKASGIKVGLLINFGKRNIQYKRLCHPDYYRAAAGDP
ncbi:MAG: GxxExxY protein, partial [Chlamydiota bacterium]|nr:GxxExxY protein [Chlamydiota bacterium]